jgi:hypothetical protein
MFFKINLLLKYCAVFKNYAGNSYKLLWISRKVHGAVLL